MSSFNMVLKKYRLPYLKSQRSIVIIKNVQIISEILMNYVFSMGYESTVVILDV